MKSFKILSKFDPSGNSPLLEVGFYAGRPFFSFTPIYKNGEKISLVTKQKIFCGLYSMDKLLIKDGIKKILSGKIKRYIFKKTFPQTQGKRIIKITGATSKYPKGSLTIIDHFQEKNILTCNLEDYEKLENVSFLEEEKISKESDAPTIIKNSSRLFALQEIYDALIMIDESVLLMNALGFGPEEKFNKDKSSDNDFNDDDDYDDFDTPSKKKSSKPSNDEEEEYVTEEEYEEEEEEETPKSKKSSKKKSKKVSEEDEDESDSDLPF